MGNIIIHEFTVEPAADASAPREETARGLEIGAQDIERLMRRVEARGERVRAY
jgi:hypothetical protein